MRNNSNVREGLFRFSKEIFKTKNNRQKILYKNAVEKYFAKFTGKYQYQGLILKTFLHCIVGYILWPFEIVSEQLFYRKPVNGYLWKEVTPVPWGETSTQF